MAHELHVPESEFERVAGRFLDNGTEAVVATVVSVDGSAYRRPGAKMLLTVERPEAGSVTAGCLAAELVDRSTAVVDDGQPRVSRFDLTASSDTWGVGLGCNGVIDVLLEPLTEEYRPLVEASEAGEAVTYVTVFGDETSIAARGVYRPGQGLVSTTGTFTPELFERIRTEIETATAHGTTETYTVDGNRVLVDGNTPPPRLLLLGHGYDIAPVVDFGKNAGFDVTVVSFRGGMELSERFPKADEVYTTAPASLAETVRLDSNTYVVIMSHNLIDDRLSFEVAVDTPVPYIGLVGPKKRFEQLCEHGSDKIEITPADDDRIYTPVGVDLGGATPPQIALSIVSEVLAVHNGREIKHLCDRVGPIHPR